MIKLQRLTIKNAFIVQIMVLALLFAGCASLRTDPLFGLTKEAPPEKVANVNIGGLISGKSNGVWIYREGIAIAEFSRKKFVLLPPGFYVFRIRSLSKFQVVQRGNVIVKKPLLYDVPLTVEAGKRYELSRIHTGTTEEIETREIP